MDIIKTMNALTEIAKRCVAADIPPETVEVNMFTGHGGRSVVRGRAIKNGVMITLDVYAD
jgi:hypothetical protein